jgi:hypothetical protein
MAAMNIKDLIKLTSLNKTEKIKLGLLAAASVILIVILITHYKSTHKKVLPKRGPAAQAAVYGKMKKPREERAHKEKTAEVQALLKEVGREDPFLQPTEKKISARTGAELVLSGIVSNGERSLAVINDMLVGEGDMIGDKKIIRIGNKGVVIRDGEKEYMLKMKGFEPEKGGK